LIHFYKRILIVDSCAVKAPKKPRKLYRSAPTYGQQHYARPGV